MLPVIAQRMLKDVSNLNSAEAAKTGGFGLDETSHTVEWGNGVSSGAVVIEAAGAPDYAGTWQVLNTVTFSGIAPKVDVVNITGAYAALRHRISTIVTDGTVSSRIDGTA